MASETSSSPPSSPKIISFISPEKALRLLRKKPSLSMSTVKKYRSMSDIMARAEYVVEEEKDYSDILCEQCSSGDNAEELLLCDKCDRGYHMKCLSPIVVRIPFGSWICPKCTVRKKVRSLSDRRVLEFFGVRWSLEQFKSDTSQAPRKRRRRPKLLVVKKRSRLLLPYVPTADSERRLKQMSSLADALRELHMKFCNQLIYSGMVPSSANRADLESNGTKLPKKDITTLNRCIDMTEQGKLPPLMVVFDKREGFAVEADGPIKDLTIIAEYTGDVDYLDNRKTDDCDSMMTLILSSQPSQSLVICADRRGNIARFISGINNHNPESRKKQNCKCFRYNVNNESRVLVIATRDISKGERLYYDYNGKEHAYPTHHFD